MRKLILALAALLALAPASALAQQQTINVGGSANDGTGDSLRTAFTKANTNFSTLFTALAGKAPTVHTHIISDVIGLQAALDGKQPLSANLTALSAFTGAGTTANTLAAGNDSRIVGAAQKAANLSDLASLATARTNLGAAKSGPNTDITSLGGLTTPLSGAQGGTGYGSISAALDGLFSSTQGAILFRGPAGWQGLGPGTAGQVLTTNGAGANPSWAAAGGAGTVQALGQVRLSYSSASALLVKPYQGNQITVNGAYQTVPSGGVTCSNAGLTAATLYYAYLYISGSTLTCEMVTTTHATGTNGVEIKSGDATRTLVGMAYTGAGTPGTFVDSGTQRFVASWFNRANRPLTTAASVAGSTSSSTATELTNYRAAFVAWADEASALTSYGMSANGNSGPTTNVQMTLDGSAVGSISAYSSAGASFSGPFSVANQIQLPEGYHLASLVASTNGGTVTVTGQLGGILRQ